MPANAPQQFLQTCLRSGVITRAALEDLLRTTPAVIREDPALLGEHLIKMKLLTRYQVTRLLAGKPKGLVLGPYEVQTPIGKGGMGVVYLARDRRTQQHIALKVLPPGRAEREERLLLRFQREMELSQRVAHPHLAWTYETGVAEGTYFIAMEFIPGKTVQRLVHDRGPLTVGRAARLFAEVASALSHAHGLGVIHRDLKPSNIMITSHDHAKVLDLGLALIEGESGVAREVIGGRGYIVGTMDYIAPEQTRNATRVDGRCDLYSLGCALYYALTGRPPFPGGTARDKIRRHREEDPPPPESINPDIPETMVLLLYRLLAKRPQERPPDAAQVERVLRSFTTGEEALPPDGRGDAEFSTAVDTLLEATASGSLQELDLDAPGKEQTPNRQLKPDREGEESGSKEADAAYAPPRGLLPNLIQGVSRNVQNMLTILGLRHPR